MHSQNASIFLALDACWGLQVLSVVVTRVLQTATFDAPSPSQMRCNIFLRMVTKPSVRHHWGIRHHSSPIKEALEGLGNIMKKSKSKFFHHSYKHRQRTREICELHKGINQPRSLNPKHHISSKDGRPYLLPHSAEKSSDSQYESTLWSAYQTGRCCALSPDCSLNNKKGLEVLSLVCIKLERNTGGRRISWEVWLGNVWGFQEGQNKIIPSVVFCPDKILKATFLWDKGWSCLPKLLINLLSTWRHGQNVTRNVFVM